jgi:methylenetetrahydrofolate dehydrogenase (NADP+)/methenyltetrahydrofolate cyclohydrolase
MILLSAKPVVEKRRSELHASTTTLRNKLGRAPHLSVILIGDDPASQVYVGRKASAALKVGFTSETIRFPTDVSAETVFKKVQALNADRKVDGVLIQRPLPQQLKERDVSLWVDPSKDVDCLHPENIGLLVTGNPRFIPCTPGGILLLLDH